jgi:hypothetical protein
VYNCLYVYYDKLDGMKDIGIKSGMPIEFVGRGILRRRDRVAVISGCRIS